MKEGTLYASSVRSAFNKLRQRHPVPEVPEADDPVRRLAVAILSADGDEDQAQRAVDRLLSSTEGWNEIRVSTPAELLRIVGQTVPNALARCEQLAAALQSIFEKENRVSLERLKALGRREARQYLENLEGVDEYVAAAVMLWSLGGHAIPVSGRLFESLQRAELVHPAASRAEVQAFLERNVAAAEAKEFCLVIQHLDGRESGEAKRTTAASRGARTNKR